MLLRFAQIVVVVMLLGLLFGCSSRYKLDLNMTVNDVERATRVEGTSYFIDAGINQISSGDRVIPSDSTNVLLARLNVTGDLLNTPGSAMFGFAEQLTALLYLTMPQNDSTTVLPLTQRSLIELVGRYDWKREQTFFYPLSGDVAIDSTTRSHLFLTIDGLFRNIDDNKIALNGRLSAKVAK
jgi:hypothetical protein